MAPIKDCWDNITIAEFMAIEEVNNSANFNSLEKMIRILAILAGTRDDHFNGLKVAELQELFKRMEFLKTPPSTDLKKYYEIGGRKYKFIGNIADLSAGQFIDLDHFTKGQTGPIDNLHYIASIFLQPVIELSFLQKLIKKTKLKKYKEVEDYLETPIEHTAENIYQNMLYSDANAICLFFCVVGQLYTAITKDYLKREMMEKMKSVLKMLSEDMTRDRKIKQKIQKVQAKIISLQDGDGLFA